MMKSALHRVADDVAKVGSTPRGHYVLVNDTEAPHHG
jgi:hypothetical protein